MSHEIKNAVYSIKGKNIVIIEHGGKAWITWASLRDLLGFPSAASFPLIEKAIDGGLGEGFTKTLIPKPINSTCMGWVLDLKSAITITEGRLGASKDPSDIKGAIHSCFERFRQNPDLPDSGGDKAESTSSSPQANDEEAESSPDKGVVTHEMLKNLSDRFDDSMGKLVLNMAENFEMRIRELEMVKYAGQLGDMGERLSNMEEQLYSYKAELGDFKLLIRSLKEATGSQVQTDIIMKLVKMVERSQTLE